MNWFGLNLTQWFALPLLKALKHKELKLTGFG